MILKVKKIFAVTVFLFFSVSFCKAQPNTVTIPDAYFVAWLDSHGFSACLNGNQMDTTCNAIVYDTILDCRYSYLSNLTTIQYFKHLKILDCSANSLTSLANLPNSLTTLKCHHNNFLTNLPSLPISLTYLDCSFDSITNLPPLTSSIRYLDCSFNKLTSLPSLPDSLRNLNCFYNFITALPSLPSVLTSLGCYKNSLTDLPVLPSSLSSLECGDNSLITLPALSSSLSWLECDHNSLTSLPSLPVSLNYLFCSYNFLTTLPTLPDTLVQLDCSSNALTILPILPGSLNDFTCSNNFLTSLPLLPSEMISFDCSNNPDLKCFPPLQNFKGDSSSVFDISNTGISCLPNIIQHPNSFFLLGIDTIPICDSTFNPNGCPLYSNTLKPINGKQNSVSIYPNPCLICEVHGIEKQGDIIVTDVVGRICQPSFSKSADGYYMQLPNYAAGIYFVRNIRTGEVAKFVKE